MSVVVLPVITCPLWEFFECFRAGALQQRSCQVVNNLLGSIYSSINPRKPLSKLYVSIYIYRRLFLIVGLIRPNFDGILWIITALSNLGTSMFIFKERPLKSRLQNLVEMFNESIICMICFSMCLLTDFTYLHEDRREFLEQVGWFIIGFKTFLIFVNVGLILLKQLSNFVILYKLAQNRCCPSKMR